MIKNGTTIILLICLFSACCDNNKLPVFYARVINGDSLEIIDKATKQVAYSEHFLPRLTAELVPGLDTFKVLLRGKTFEWYAKDGWKKRPLVHHTLNVWKENRRYYVVGDSRIRFNFTLSDAAIRDADSIYNTLLAQEQKDSTQLRDLLKILYVCSILGDEESSDKLYNFREHFPQVPDSVIDDLIRDYYEYINYYPPI